MKLQGYPGTFSLMEPQDQVKEPPHAFALVADFGGGERGKLILLTRAEDARRIAEPELGAVYPRELAEKVLSESERYRSLQSLRRCIAVVPKKQLVELQRRWLKRQGGR